MKLWLKILIAFICSGLAGSASFAAGQYPDYAMVLASAATTVSLLSSAVIGWPAKEE